MKIFTINYKDINLDTCSVRIPTESGETLYYSAIFQEYYRKYGVTEDFKMCIFVLDKKENFEEVINRFKLYFSIYNNIDLFILDIMELYCSNNNSVLLDAIKAIYHLYAHYADYIYMDEIWSTYRILYRKKDDKNEEN